MMSGVRVEKPLALSGECSAMGADGPECRGDLFSLVSPVGIGGTSVSVTLCRAHCIDMAKAIAGACKWDGFPRRADDEVAEAPTPNPFARPTPGVSSEQWSALGDASGRIDAVADRHQATRDALGYCTDTGPATDDLAHLVTLAAAFAESGDPPDDAVSNARRAMERLQKGRS